MAVRVWGMVGDRLIEIRPESSARPGITIDGLPEDRARTTADRVRAAILNSGLVNEVPPVLARIEPAVAGRTDELDVALALAALVCAGIVGSDLRWILGTGRLGLDGRVHLAGLEPAPSLAGVAQRLCQTPLIGFERMFGSREP